MSNHTLTTIASRVGRDRNEATKIERFGDEGINKRDTERRINNWDEFDRNTFRYYQSDRNTNTSTRDFIHSKQDKADLHRERHREYGERTDDNGYTDEARNIMYRDNDRDNRNNNIDNRHTRGDKTRVATFYRQKENHRIKGGNGDRSSTPFEERRYRHGVESGNNRYERVRSQEHTQNRWTGEESYMGNNKHEGDVYREDNSCEVANERRTPHKLESDERRRQKPIKRNREEPYGEEGYHKKIKKRRSRNKDSIPLNDSADEDTDIEDGEYRSPERDITFTDEEMIMNDKEYKQQDTLGYSDMSYKGSNSFVGCKNADPDTNSNKNTWDLTSVSSESFSDDGFRNANEDAMSSIGIQMNGGSGYVDVRSEDMSDQKHKNVINGISTTYDENEAIVQFQSALFAKKRITVEEVKELLQNVTDSLHQDIAAEMMPFMIEGESDLTANEVFDKLRERDNSFDNWIEIKEVIDERFATENAASSNDGDLETLIFCKPNPCLMKICTKLSNKRSSTNCNCNDLHICKFFMLSECQEKFCRFGHDLKTEHNIRVLKKHCLHRLTTKQLKRFIRQKENRNETTTPLICKFYNIQRGCKYEIESENAQCPCMHVCKHYFQDACKFGRKCKRSHNILQGQPQKVLKLYGLDETPVEDIILLLKRNNGLPNQAVMELNNLIQKAEGEKNLNHNTLIQKGRIEECTDYIPIDKKREAVRERYFTLDVSMQNENGKAPKQALTRGQGVDLAQNQHDHKRNISDTFSGTKCFTEAYNLKESEDLNNEKRPMTNVHVEPEPTIITREDMVNCCVLDSDTQTISRKPECDPIVDPVKIDKTVPAMENQLVADLHKHEEEMMKKYVEEGTEPIVQVLLKSMLETIVDGTIRKGEVSMDLHRIRLQPTLEIAKIDLEEEISSGRRCGISMDEEMINASSVPESIHDKPNNNNAIDVNHSDFYDFKKNALPEVEEKLDAPQDSGSCGSNYDVFMNETKLGAGSALRETNKDSVGIVSGVSSYADMEDANASPSLEITKDINSSGETDDALMDKGNLCSGSL